MKYKNIILVLLLVLPAVSRSQNYLESFYGYFSRELSSNPAVSHEQDDSISYSADLSIDSLQAIDSIQVKVSDSSGINNYFTNVHIGANEDYSGYTMRLDSGVQIPVNFPHSLRTRMPASQMNQMRWVLVRFRLKTGQWVNVVNQSIGA